MLAEEFLDGQIAYSLLMGLEVDVGLYGDGVVTGVLGVVLSGILSRRHPSERQAVHEAVAWYLSE